MADDFMTSTEVCQYLGCSVAVLNRLDKKNILKPIRRLPFNGKRLYSQNDIDRYLESITTQNQFNR